MMPEQPSPNLSTESRCVAVIDVGTTGIKAFIFDAHEKILSRAYQTITKQVEGNRVEQNPREILFSAINVLRKAISNAGIDPAAIDSVGITNQRETVIAWNSITGESFHPAIVWEDTRTAARCHWLNFMGKGRHVRHTTGLPIIPYFSATKIHWLMKNVPAIREHAVNGTLRVGTVDTWLLWNLTEGNQYKTDFTNASRTLLFNIRTLQWDPYLCTLFGVPLHILPQAVSSKSEFGTLKKDVAGAAIPVRAICGDQQASMYAAGIATGTTKITYGTGAFIMQILGTIPRRTISFFVTVVPDGKQGVRYALEAKVGRCGSRVTPFIEHPTQLREIFKIIATEINYYIKRLPRKPETIIADGGIIRSPEILHIQSTISGSLVYPQKTFDGTALGIARLLL
jgi:glycerol kinase